MPNKKVDKLTLTIDGVDIEIINQFNILNFTLISCLNWSKHIDKMANRSWTIGLTIATHAVINILFFYHSFSTHITHKVANVN